MQIRKVEKKIISLKRKEIILKLFKEGWQIGEISKILNLDRTWVWRVVTTG